MTLKLICSSYQKSARNLIPDFLIPAFFCTKSIRLFSTAQKRQSKVGAAPLSVPKEVNLRILEPLKQGKRKISREEPLEAVEVEGPLGFHFVSMYFWWKGLILKAGKLTVRLPSYMSINHDEGARKATLAIRDNRERKQREMWGECISSYSMVLSWSS